MLWPRESFAYADSFDELAGRYRGLRCGPPVVASLDSTEGLLVKPDVAIKQQETEAPGKGTEGTGPPAPTPVPGKPDPVRPASLPQRFHGTVALDPTRVGRDAGRIAEEVIAHLVGLMGSEVAVTLEIEAKIPSGVPDNVVRTVTENSRTLKFASQGFEEN